MRGAARVRVLAQEVSNADGRCCGEIDDDEFAQTHGDNDKGNVYASKRSVVADARRDRRHSFTANSLVVCDRRRCKDRRAATTNDHVGKARLRAQVIGILQNVCLYARTSKGLADT